MMTHDFLNTLPKGHHSVVTGIRTSDRDLEEALREQGFLEGAIVEVLEKGLLGGTPIAILLGRSIIALRASEAAAVEIMPQ